MEYYFCIKFSLTWSRQNFRSREHSLCCKCIEYISFSIFYIPEFFDFFFTCGFCDFPCRKKSDGICRPRAIIVCRLPNRWLCFRCIFPNLRSRTSTWTFPDSKIAHCSMITISKFKVMKPSWTQPSEKKDSENYRREFFMGNLHHR